MTGNRCQVSNGEIEIWIALIHLEKAQVAQSSGLDDAEELSALVSYKPSCSGVWKWCQIR